MLKIPLLMCLKLTPVPLLSILQLITHVVKNVWHCYNTINNIMVSNKLVELFFKSLDHTIITTLQHEIKVECLLVLLSATKSTISADFISPDSGGGNT